MSAPVFFTTPDEPIEKCLALMTERHIRHLPVIEDGQMIGIISIGDLVKTIIDDQKDWIRALENHVLTNTSIV
jgi:CBS domain-containing protein